MNRRGGQRPAGARRGWSARCERQRDREGENGNEAGLCFCGLGAPPKDIGRTTTQEVRVGYPGQLKGSRWGRQAHLLKSSEEVPLLQSSHHLHSLRPLSGPSARKRPVCTSRPPWLSSGTVHRRTTRPRAGQMARRTMLLESRKMANTMRGPQGPTCLPRAAEFF